MREFQCLKCDCIFKSVGEKKESTHSIYGHIWKWQAKHTCDNWCDEYEKPVIKVKKKKRRICPKNCPTCPYK